MPGDEEIKVDLAQVKEALTEGLAAADPTRAQGLATLLRLTQARDAGLRREQLRLSKLLPPDDPRLAAIAVRLQTGNDLSEHVAFEARRAESGLDRADPKAWTLQGHFFVTDETWLEGKAVALFDGSGDVIVNSEADLDGTRFVIRYQVPTSDTTGRGTPPVFVGLVSVNERRRRRVFLDPRPLTPQNGRITHVEVNVGVPPRLQPPGGRPTPPDPDGPQRSRGATGKKRAGGARRPSRPDRSGPS